MAVVHLELKTKQVMKIVDDFIEEAESNEDMYTLVDKVLRGLSKFQEVDWTRFENFCHRQRRKQDLDEQRSRLKPRAVACEDVEEEPDSPPRVERTKGVN
jgi:hypothetical protein